MDKENACNSAIRNDVPEASKNDNISLLEESSVCCRDKMMVVGGNIAVETTATDGIRHGAAKNASPMLVHAAPRSAILRNMKRKRQEKNDSRDNRVASTRPRSGFEKAVEAALQSSVTPTTSGASEEHQTTWQEAISTDKSSTTFEKDDTPETTPPPICKEEVATLQPPHKRVRLSHDVCKDTPIELLDDDDDPSGVTEERSKPNKGSANFVEKIRSHLPNAADTDNSTVVSQQPQGSRKDDAKTSDGTHPSPLDGRSFNGSAAPTIRSTLRHCQIDSGRSTVGIMNKGSTTARATDRAAQHPPYDLPEERPSRCQVEQGRSVEPSRRLDATKPVWRTVSREHALSVLQRYPKFPFHGIITPQPMPGMKTDVWFNSVVVSQWLQRNI
jgi:hypothetical protein